MEIRATTVPHASTEPTEQTEPNRVKTASNKKGATLHEWWGSVFAFVLHVL